LTGASVRRKRGGRDEIELTPGVLAAEKKEGRERWRGLVGRKAARVGPLLNKGRVKSAQRTRLSFAKLKNLALN
jgi:hypothetical protein